MGLFNFLKLKKRILPTELSVDNFRPSVMNSPVPVVVDFYSPTCAPCSQMGRTITKFATDYNGKVRVGAFDVSQDEEAKVLAEFGIRSVPTIILFNKGKVVETFVGVTGYLKIAEAVDKLVEGK